MIDKYGGKCIYLTILKNAKSIRESEKEFQKMKKNNGGTETGKTLCNLFAILKRVMRLFWKFATRHLTTGIHKAFEEFPLKIEIELLVQSPEFILRSIPETTFQNKK